MLHIFKDSVITYDEKSDPVAHKLNVMLSSTCSSTSIVGKLAPCLVDSCVDNRKHFYFESNAINEVLFTYMFNALFIQLEKCI